ncbi:MAG: hypothetical protein ABFD06_06010 [Smithella sp.]
MSTNKYENQPDQATFTYRYKVPATAGETFEVKASCNLYGSKTMDLNSVSPEETLTLDGNKTDWIICKQRGDVWT